MKKQQGVEPLYAPEDASNVGTVTIVADMTLHAGPSVAPTCVGGKGTTVFDANGWESEMLWLLCRIMARDFGRGPDDIKGALESCLKNLGRL
jgi:hypothetical protein